MQNYSSEIKSALVYGSFIVIEKLNTTVTELYDNRNSPNTVGILPYSRPTSPSPTPGERASSGKNNRGGPFAESAPELSFLIVGNQNYPQREVPHEVQMRHPS